MKLKIPVLLISILFIFLFYTYKSYRNYQIEAYNFIGAVKCKDTIYLNNKISSKKDLVLLNKYKLFLEKVSQDSITFCNIKISKIESNDNFRIYNLDNNQKIAFGFDIFYNWRVTNIYE